LQLWLFPNILNLEKTAFTYYLINRYFMQKYSYLLILFLIIYSGVSYAQPANNNPCNAIDISVNSTCTYQTYTTSGANAFTGTGISNSCINSGLFCSGNPTGDVWFTLTIPTTDPVFINTASVGGGMADPVIQVYTGDVCAGTGALMGCISNSSTNPFPGYVVSGLPIGTVIYIRIVNEVTGFISCSATGLGNFRICASTTQCGTAAMPGQTCASATAVCDLNGFCGQTIGYTANVWSQLTSGFSCGSIENNSFMTFVASASTVTLNVNVSGCTNNDGIQFYVFSTTACGSGSVTSHHCTQQMLPGNSTLNFTALTPGQTYFLMVDGFAGDVCTYNLSIPGGGGGILLPVNAGPDLSDCGGNGVTLSVTGGQGPYNWTDSQGNAVGTGSSIFVNPAITETYSVEGQSGNPLCPNSAIDQVTVFVAPPLNTPAISVLPDPEICSGTDVVLITTGEIGATFNWITPVSCGSANNDTFSVNAISSNCSGIYAVSQSLNGCTSDTAEVVINVLPSPSTPQVISPVNYCLNDPSQALSATGDSLLWYSPGAGAGNLTAPTPVTSIVGTEYFYVTSTSINGCVSDSAEIIVNIGNLPAKPSVISPIEYCEEDIAPALTAGGSDLLWYIDTLTGPGDVNAPTPNTSITDTLYFFVSQSNNGCRSGYEQIQVIINPKPTAPTVTSPVNYCQGDIASALTASGSDLLWYPNPTGGSGDDNAPVPNTNITGTVSYYVSQTNAQGCESNRAEIVVNVNSIPAIPTVTSPVNYCEGDPSSPLTATGSNLLWYTSSTGGTGSQNAPTPNTTSANSTSYYVTQTNITECESGRAEILVIVNEIPAIPTVTSPVNYCEGDVPQQLSAQGANLTWYTSPTGGSGSAAVPTPTTSASGQQTYYVSQTVNNCESDRAEIIVNITAKPSTPLANPAIEYCAGDNANPLSASGNSLTWYPSATSPNGSPNAPTPSTSAPGTFNFYVSQTVNGCESERTLITVTVKPLPNAPSVNNDGHSCVGLTANLSASNVPNASYNWTGPNGFSSTDQNPVLTDLTINDFGTYTVTVTVNGCNSQPVSTILEYDPVLANFNASTTEGLSPLLVDFINNSSNASAYVWYIGSDTSYIITNPSHVFTEEGVYNVILYAYGINNTACMDSAMITITVKGESMLETPNVFTPNGDGVNDVFKVKGVNITHLSGEIYNRWGKKVYSWEGPDNGWDGNNFSGSQCADGTYFYIIKAEGKDGNIFNEKGTITLLR
jgi:gliding motility-associated-like protein